MKKNIQIGPGFLTDLLIELREEGKISLGRWIYPIYKIPSPRHQIYLKGGHSYYYVKRREK